jgi:hypothetical protein
MNPNGFGTATRVRADSLSRRAAVRGIAGGD